MQIFKLCLIAFLFVCLNNTFAQVQVQPGCSEVTVMGGIPNYQDNLYNGPFVQQTKCKAVIQNPSWTMKHRLFLEQLDHSTGTFSTVAGPQFPPNNTFSGLSHGTFRIRAEVPVAITSISCISGFINVCNTLEQLVGFGGDYLGTEGSVAFSDPFVIGETTSDDIDYTFIDDPETGSEFTYDFGETVIINTEDCKNYNRWFLSIQESGPNFNRYRSTGGWVAGTIPAEFNLTQFWDISGTWGNFRTFHSYEVQLVISNEDCHNGGWTSLVQTFFICPAGSGCRLSLEEKGITISPNPADDAIQFQNFESDPNREYQLQISDFTGRVFRNTPLIGDRADISELQTGIYVVSISEKGKPIYQTKLIVQ